MAQFKVADVRNVYQMAYAWYPEEESSGTWNIEFAVVKGLEKFSCDRLSFRCRMLREPATHWRAGVSGTFVFSPSYAEAEAGEHELPMLERNVGDLITMYVTDAVRSGECTIVIMGAPLPGLVGRIAYRCLSRKAVIAFLTWGNPICRGPRFKSEGTFSAVYSAPIRKV